MGCGCVGEDAIHNNVENVARQRNIKNDNKYVLLSYT